MKAKIENGEIIITIDIAALACAVVSGPIGNDHFGLQVVDFEKLAQWVVARFTEETDDAPRLGLLIEEEIGEALNYGECPEDMGIVVDEEDA